MVCNGMYVWFLDRWIEDTGFPLMTFLYHGCYHSDFGLEVQSTSSWNSDR